MPRQTGPTYTHACANFFTPVYAHVDAQGRTHVKPHVYTHVGTNAHAENFPR